MWCSCFWFCFGITLAMQHGYSSISNACNQMMWTSPKDPYFSIICSCCEGLPLLVVTSMWIQNKPWSWNHRSVHCLHYGVYLNLQYSLVTFVVMPYANIIITSIHFLWENNPNLPTSSLFKMKNESYAQTKCIIFINKSIII